MISTKSIHQRFATSASALVVLALASCTNTPQPVAPSAATPPPRVSTGEAPAPAPASTNVQVINIEAGWANVTVQSIDYNNRKVLLRRADGALFDCKVGPLAVNFDKVKVGDQLRITIAEECVTFVGRGTAKPGAEADAAIVRVLVNGVPSGMAAMTTDVRAKVMDVDLVTRRIIAEVKKGDARSLKVANGVDLTNLRPGDEVWVRLTEAMAVKIERPQ